jgi:hypothetical protein
MPRRRNRDRPMRARLAGVRKSQDYSIDRLARDLAGDEELVERDEDGAIVLRSGFGETWDPPVRLAVTDAQLRERLLSMDDARDVFPDVDPLQAAYQLLLVYLAGELATSAMAGSRITMGAGSFDVDPVRELEPWPHLDPDGDHAWIAEPPHGFDGQLEFMSPEQYAVRYWAHFGHDPDMSQVRRRPPPE